MPRLADTALSILDLAPIRDDGGPAQALQNALALARQLNLQEQIALTLNDLARAYSGSGRRRMGLEALEEARQIWRSRENLPMLAENLSSSASISMIGGEYDRALALARRILNL